MSSDGQWAETALNRGIVTPEQIQQAFSNRRGDIDLSDLASILVPRGITPESLAASSEAWFGSGRDSERHNMALEEFRTMMESDSEAIRSVGIAGIELFEPKYQQALRAEKMKNFKGDL